MTNLAGGTEVNEARPIVLTEAQLHGRIQDLESRLTGFQRDQESLAETCSITIAEKLSALEGEAIQLGSQLDRSEGGLNGNALLADVQEQQALCIRLGLAAAADAADELIFSDLEHVAQAFRESLAPILNAPQPDACFAALFQTTAHELEAERHDSSPTERQTVFTEVRQELRRAFLTALNASPPSAEMVLHWVRDLIDRGDLVLTGIDALPADRAVTQLEIVIEDFRWHLQHVETRWNRRRRRLKRKLRQLVAQRQERRLQDRLDRRFGRTFVRRADRLILGLICLVVVLILIDGVYDLPARARFWLNVFDGAACVVFLSEFFIKLSLVSGRWTWFWRHFLIDFVPSIPIGLLILAVPGAAGQAASPVGFFGRVFRVVRVVRLARFLRGFGLMARGFDRLARQYGHVLNQNVILYPTREELDRSRSRLPAQRASLKRLRVQIQNAWRDVLTEMPPAERPAAVERRLATFAGALEQRRTREFGSAFAPRTGGREIAAEVLIQQLSTMTPQGAEVGLGPELLTQLARIVRILARIPFRWLPIISSLVPRVTKDTSDAEVVAAASQRTARVVRRFHNAWFWVADLYGTVTPSQFVDRVGGMLVKGSFKPAYRMLLFGGLFLLTDLLLRLAPMVILEPVRDFLNRYVGPTVLILGSTCFLILGVGWWLQRVAREATEFYERAAQAQFLSLTEIIRSRSLRRDAEILYRRVLKPERLLDSANHDTTDDTADQASIEQVLARIHQSLVEAHLGSGNGQGWRGLDTVLLLYRDSLDGAIFNDNDTRSTSQLLGSPAVRQFLSLSGRIGSKETKALQALDLVRQKSVFGGPYLWFNFISRSIAHSVANLLIDYNQHVIPLNERPHVSDKQRRQFESWLTEKTSESLASEAHEENVERDYVTTAFTALHFLDFDEERDAEVSDRFGSDVLHRLQRDRGFLIRRIFGTYPMHNRPKEQRVVNLYSLYGSWLSGGRALFLPWFLFLLVLELCGGFLIWVARSVQQIRRPELRRDSGDAAQSHFLTAVRKIERIRGPVVYASTRLRMRMDPEFLGVPLPRQRQTSIEEASLEHDLQFLQPVPEFLDEVQAERRRAQADLQRLEALIDQGLLERIAQRRGLPAEALTTPEHLRAAAVAYLADYRGVRRRLSALAILQELVRLAETKPLRPGKLFPRWFLKRKFNRYWARHGFGNLHTRLAAWRAILNNVWGSADALTVWCETPAFTPERGEELLGELLLHPGRISEQLITLRAIQTLAVMDVLCYREHVYHLGRYEDVGDAADGLLTW